MKATIRPSIPNGKIKAIASKSAAHRLLICAAFADKTTELICEEINEDISATVRCLNALGAKITRKENSFVVLPIRKVRENPVLDCGESGSTLRFLVPIVATLGCNASFVMSGRLPDRPLSPLREELERHGKDIPVFGMVKDDYHKTRALCTESDEINIAKDKAVYMLVYKLQEEVHRYTVSKTMGGKRKTLRRSSLENIEGIGPSKASKLLSHFGTLGALKAASVEEISAAKGISQRDAEAVYGHFHKNDNR